MLKEEESALVGGIGLDDGCCGGRKIFGGKERDTSSEMEGMGELRRMGM